ncbi:MAG: hypothetical protein NT023_24145 [Armatimonadetes bacterium]|nr:hypothetical protein [Armatimonadota bacterium]
MNRPRAKKRRAVPLYQENYLTMLGLLCLFALTTNTPAQTIPLTPPSNYSIASSRDTRLNALCELHCKGVMLRDVVKDLATQTNIRIKTQGKWASELRAAIFTKPLPLRVMMTRLSNLFHLSWKAEGENANEATYTLYESAGDRQYVQGLKDAGWRSVMANIKKAREYASLPDIELNRRAEMGDRMARGVLEHLGERDLWSLVWGLSDASCEKLIKKRPLHFRYDQLSPDLQGCLLRVQQQKDSLNEQSHEQSRKEDPSLPPYTPTPYAPNDLRLRYLMHGEGVTAQLHIFYEVNKSGSSRHYPLLQRVDPPDLWYKERFERTQRLLSASKRAVNRKIQEDISLSAKNWDDAAEQLHRKLGLNIFTDSFLSYMDSRKIETLHSFDEGTRLSDVLAKSGEWGRLWWQEGAGGDDILLCSSWWYEVHTPNNYETLLKRIQDSPKGKRPFTLDDLAEIDTLPGVMISWLEETTGIELFITERHSSVYRLYHSLSASEKSTLVDSGIKKTSLASIKWTEFQDILDDIHSGLTAAQREGAILVLDCSKDMSVLNLKWMDGSGEWWTEEVMHCGLLPAFVQKRREKEKTK